MNNIYIALVHNPVLNKHNDKVTTSITNLDLHDISRSAKTFGIKKFFCINNLESQEKFFKRIKKFWQTDIAGKYNSDRVNAFQIAEYSKTINATKKMINNQEGQDPIVISTTAKKMENRIKFAAIKELKAKKPILILFGTGNGLEKSVHDDADYVLEPISGMGKYNHLSVRSAVAIILDRINSDI